MTAASIGHSVATLSPQMGWLSVVRPDDGLGVSVPREESPDDELTTGQAAKRAGVSRWKVIRDAKSGKLPSRQVDAGSREPEFRFRRGDVDAYRGVSTVDLLKLREDADAHAAELAELRARVELLEQRQPPTE